MKREELEKIGLSKEQIDQVMDLHHAELDPVQRERDNVKADLEAEKQKSSSQENTIKDLQKDLDGFKDADVTGMQNRIRDLEADLETQKTTHQQQMAERDFNELLRDEIATAKGRNAKAITALLDVETLKTSKNQKEDISKALKDLAEAEDSSMLFGVSSTETIGIGGVIGRINKPTGNTEDAAMRAAMGLPPVKE